MTLFILYTSGQCTAFISEFHVHWPNAGYLQLRFLLVGNLINLPHTLAFLVFWARVFSSRLSHVGLCTSRNPIPKHYRNILASRKTMQTVAIHRGAGAGPTGTAAAGPMLKTKLMNLIKGIDSIYLRKVYAIYVKGRLQKF